MADPATAPSIDAGPPTVGDTSPGGYSTPAGSMPTVDNPLTVSGQQPGAIPVSPYMTPQMQNIQLSDMPQPNFNINVPFNQQVAGFMQSPWGQATQAIVPGLVGLYGAQQQQRLGNQVAGTIPAAVQPATSLGAGVSRQLQGGPQMPGPYGPSIAQQTGAAAKLGNVANEYASGQLTPAQQLALQQGVNAATASKNLAFSMSGNPLSSASIAEQQNIQNQAIIASQQIQQNNINLAQSALGAVQNTYNSLVSQVMTSAGLGGTAANAAARLIMANNSQVQQQISAIWQNIAKSILAAMPGAQKPGGGQMTQSDWTAILNKFKGILGGNQPGTVNPQPGQQQTTDTQTVPQYNEQPYNPGGANLPTDTSAQTVPQLSDMGGGSTTASTDQTSSDQTVTPGG